MMKNFFILFLALCGLISELRAQSEVDLVEEKIELLYAAMERSDSAAASELFSSSAFLRSMIETDVSIQIDSDKTEDFLASLAKAAPGSWREQALSMQTDVDGLMARSRVPYLFYYNGILHHYGVNYFQFVYEDKDWKILGISDTRISGIPASTTIGNGKVNSFMDNWHQAAAIADGELFFGSLAPDAIYIGTDPDELWTKEEFQQWSQKYFERDTAWAFKPFDRNIYWSSDSNYIWFDEKLDTWMGECRGSGVLEINNNDLKIKHYHLSISVPNADVNQVIDVISADEK